MPDDTKKRSIHGAARPADMIDAAHALRDRAKSQAGEFADGVELWTTLSIIGLMKAQIDGIRVRAGKLRAQADRMQEAVRLLEAELPEMKGRAAQRKALDAARLRALREMGISKAEALRRLRSGALHPGSEQGTFAEMDTPSPVDASHGARISASMTRHHEYPLRKALIRRGLSLPEWAKQKKDPPLSVNTAKSWLKTGGSGRPCPRPWAERIAAEFTDDDGKSEVPAVDESWPNGISD